MYLSAPRPVGFVRRRALALTLASSVVGGCAAHGDELDKQLAAMRSEITGLRAENAALNERVDALEIANGSLKGYKPPAASSAAPPPSDKPDLAVVKLKPGGDTPGDAGADDGPRVILRSTGKGIVQEEAKDDGSPGPSAEFAKAKELYDKKSYAEAMSAFSTFLVRYPDHAKAPDATFYRGEIYVAKSEYKSAVEQLEAVVKTAPTSDRVPDALLDLAKSYDKLGDKDAADKARKKLKSDFPKSNAAKKLN